MERNQTDEMKHAYLEDQRVVRHEALHQRTPRLHQRRARKVRGSKCAGRLRRRQSPVGCTARPSRVRPSTASAAIGGRAGATATPFFEVLPQGLPLVPTRQLAVGACGRTRVLYGQ